MNLLKRDKQVPSYWLNTFGPSISATRLLYLVQSARANYIVDSRLVPVGTVLNPCDADMNNLRLHLRRVRRV